uniref:G_PROTEIN_RECEP_F1_2 domain-containing protein n=1 Tax=Haemonchus contortus TaxID=6289 RepID=A0A7I4YQW3_HAECO
MIGNGFIVYVTAQSKSLRCPCSILIAAVSLSDMMLVSSSLASTAFHNIVQSDSIPLATCVYLQLLSLFATCSSPMLLLSLAIDRLFSLSRFYQTLVTSHSGLYIMALILPGCLLGVIMDVVVLIYRMKEERVTCLLASPMQGKIMENYTKSALVVCCLILLCYGCFIFFLRRLQLNSTIAKSIHRSILIISLSFVFGYFATVIILLCNTLLRLDIDMVYLNQSAGIFVSLATSCNFFIYYIIRNSIESFSTVFWELDV